MACDDVGECDRLAPCARAPGSGRQRRRRQGMRHARRRPGARRRRRRAPAPTPCVSNDCAVPRVGRGASQRAWTPRGVAPRLRVQIQRRRVGFWQRGVLLARRAWHQRHGVDADALVDKAHVRRVDLDLARIHSHTLTARIEARRCERIPQVRRPVERNRFAATVCQCHEQAGDATDRLGRDACEEHMIYTRI